MGALKKNIGRTFIVAPLICITLLAISCGPPGATTPEFVVAPATMAAIQLNFVDAAQTTKAIQTIESGLTSSQLNAQDILSLDRALTDIQYASSTLNTLSSGGVDVTAEVVLVMMLAAANADDDLKSILADLQGVVSQKQVLHDAITQLEGQVAVVVAAIGKSYQSADRSGLGGKAPTIITVEMPVVVGLGRIAHMIHDANNAGPVKLAINCADGAPATTVTLRDKVTGATLGEITAPAAGTASLSINLPAGPFVAVEVAVTSDVASNPNSSLPKAALCDLALTYSHSGGNTPTLSSTAQADLITLRQQLISDLTSFEAEANGLATNSTFVKNVGMPLLISVYQDTYLQILASAMPWLGSPIPGLAAGESANLDAINDLGQMQDTRLQLLMNRQQVLMQTISGIVKTVSDTSNSIVQNLK